MPVAKLDSLKPQQVVKPATDVMAEKLSKALRMDVNKGTAFRVLAIVEKGTDYLGRSASGLIVEPVTAPGAFPFVFSADTFRVPAEVARPAATTPTVAIPCGDPDCGCDGSGTDEE